MKNSTENFKFSCPLKIRWRDMDAHKTVSNTVFLDFLERGWYAYLEKVLNMDTTKVIITIDSVSLDFKDSVYFEDNPRMYVQCKQVEDNKMLFDYLIMANREGEEEILTTVAEAVLIFSDPSSKNPFNIDDEDIGVISNFEGFDVSGGRVREGK